MTASIVLETVRGVLEAGLTTTVLPAKRACCIGIQVKHTGQFQGLITDTTPIGSLFTRHQPGGSCTISCCAISLSAMVEERRSTKTGSMQSPIDSDTTLPCSLVSSCGHSASTANCSNRSAASSRMFARSLMSNLLQAG